MPWISNNYTNSTEACVQSRDTLQDLIVRLEDKQHSVERLYLMYYMCELVSQKDEDSAINFFNAMFPIPLKKNIATFITQLVSLSLHLGSNQILTACSIYLEKEQIKIPDVKNLPLDLAKKSPLFVSVLLDKGVFIASGSKSNHHLYSSQLLSRWLFDLNNSSCSKKIMFNGQSLIRFSLVGQGQNDSELHVNILEAIQSKKIHSVSNQFIIDIATQLSQKGNSNLIEKFAQILVVGVQNGLCNTLVHSNQMKNHLSSLFPDHFLMTTVVCMKAPK